MAHKIIKVPDTPGPKGICWKQKLTPPHAMARCTRKAGHKGPHTWEVK